MSLSFEDLARRYVEGWPALCPVYATYLGDHRFDRLLDDVSVRARQERAEFCEALLAGAEAVDPAGLSAQDRIDLSMLLHRLRSQIWSLRTLQEWAWNPTLYTGLAGDAVYSLLARDFAPLGERLAAAKFRLEQLPRLLEQVRGVLDASRVPQVHARTALRQNRGLHGLVDQAAREARVAMTGADAAGLEAAAERARQAIDEHQRWLEDVLLPAARGEYRLGAARYSDKLAFSLDSPLSAEQVARTAWQQYEATRERMHELAARIRSERGGDLPDPPSSLGDRASDADRLIASCLELACRDALDVGRLVGEATDALASATRFVAERDLVALPDEPCRIIEMPEFRRGVSLAYCDSPGPLERGQATFYAISPPPSDWKPQQVSSMLREYNRRSLRNLTVHEAMPGHFLQLTRANRCPSSLRRMLASGTFIEGWAVYTERLMAEQGWGGDDPLYRLVVEKWRLRGIVNALLDQAVHSQGMEEAEAMRLMRVGAFQEESEAAGKWTRAQLTAGQLSTYFVGTQEHDALRAEVRRAWGSAFTLRRYHDALLAHGSPPVRCVRELLLGPA